MAKGYRKKSVKFAAEASAKDVSSTGQHQEKPGGGDGHEGERILKEILSEIREGSDDRRDLRDELKGLKEANDALTTCINGQTKLHLDRIEAMEKRHTDEIRALMAENERIRKILEQQNLVLEKLVVAQKDCKAVDNGEVRAKVSEEVNDSVEQVLENVDYSRPGYHPPPPPPPPTKLDRTKSRNRPRIHPLKIPFTSPTPKNGGQNLSLRC